MDRDKLKDKIREKIGIELCSVCSDSGLCLKDNGYCSCAEEADLALTAIEDAGFVIVPSNLSVNKRRVLEAMLQAFPGIKGETVSREGALQATDGAEAMDHLGEVLSFFANLDEGDRCRAFEKAVVFYNKHNPNSQIQGEPGFTWHICQQGPLGFNCRRQIEEPANAGDEMTAASDGDQESKPT